MDEIDEQRTKKQNAHKKHLRFQDFAHHQNSQIAAFFSLGLSLQPKGVTTPFLPCHFNRDRFVALKVCVDSRVAWMSRDGS